MATRALIGYLGEDRNFTCTYNHYDGYPENLGKALLDFYDSEERAKSIANEGYISYVDAETGDLNQAHDEQPTKMKLDGSWEDAQEEMAGMVDEFGGNYGYIWYEGEGAWTTLKNNGIRSMMDQIDDKMSLAASMFGPVDENKKEEMEENYKSKWENFITENQAIDDQWGVYIKSLVNDIRLNGVEQYADFDIKDFQEDFNNYIGDKMGS
jgi:hypothetical protein